MQVYKLQPQESRADISIARGFMSYFRLFSMPFELGSTVNKENHGFPTHRRFIMA
uniref:Uncharacterized protein n=1 Tax=Triticum urartu TaxID=4572 RepID=A0A8R7V0N3_TRIUA